MSKQSRNKAEQKRRHDERLGVINTAIASLNVLDMPERAKLLSARKALDPGAAYMRALAYLDVPPGADLRRLDLGGISYGPVDDWFFAYAGSNSPADVSPPKGSLDRTYGKGYTKLGNLAAAQQARQGASDRPLIHHDDILDPLGWRITPPTGWRPDTLIFDEVTYIK